MLRYGKINPSSFENVAQSRKINKNFTQLFTCEMDLNRSLTMLKYKQPSHMAWLQPQT